MSELTIPEAVDLAERYVTRIAKPFERVRDVLRAAIEAEAQRQAAEAAVEGLRRDRRALTDETDALRAEMEALRQRANEETLTIAQEMQALREQLHEVRNQAQAEIAIAREKAAAAIAEAEADAGARKVGLQAEIAGLEARKAELDKTFEVARANLALLTR